MTIDLNRERWGRLVAEARVAAANPHLDPAELGKRATAMREAPSPVGGYGLCACNTFRWACLWFSQADALSRAGLSPILDQLAERVGYLIEPQTTPPTAAAAPLPADAVGSDDEFAWQRRADAGRG